MPASTSIPPPRDSGALGARSDSIPTAVIETAIAWAVKIEFNTPSPDVRAAFDAWLNASPVHAIAWQRLQSLQDDFAAVPPKLALEALQSAEAERQENGVNRRQILKLLSLVGGAGVAAWIAHDQTPWQRLLADADTGTGARRSMTLSDGTTVLLNTDSAINIKLNESRRLIELRRGEIQISTGTDSSAPEHRPFWVGTPFGRMRALGTRFVVRLDPAAARVSVQQGAVALYPDTDTNDRDAVAHPGESWMLARTRVTRAAVADFDPLAWVDGVIIAKQMRLADLLAELSRYRRGYISCDEAIADLRLTGVYHTDDIDRTLEFLAQTAPVSVAYYTRFWVVVKPLDPSRQQA